jgi:hypothetical protein
MVRSTPSIAEEDETRDNDQYDYDRVHFPNDDIKQTNLVTNQDEQLPLNTTT